ncbi:hypothetical protein GCM10022252_75850 [Streptosporangium oxazolinicum]|uniref:Uncharacterized protein n=1 Tax=Streptosporangium oxazolinicum TaxID=909287 RepID=A0ABP8BL43_9ACTN
MGHSHQQFWPAGARPVQLPARAEGSAKSWIKAVYGVTPDAAASHRSKGAALDGVFLERAGTYALQPGVLLVAYDKVGDEATVILYKVIDGDEPLSVVKKWANKQGILGQQMLNGITTQVKKTKGGPPRIGALADITLTEPPPQLNGREEDCHLCYQNVPAGQGVLARVEGRTRVQHSPACPLPPPQRNTYEQPCRRCRQNVPAGEGLRSKPYEHGPWEVIHDGVCPPPSETTTAAPAARVNGKPGPCTSCLQEVPAGTGELHGGPGNWSVKHRGSCPPHPLNPTGAPTWRITSSNSPTHGFREEGWAAGTVFRATLWNTPAEKLPAETVPGYARLDEQRVTFVAVSVAYTAYREKDYDDDEWYTYRKTILRVATPEEAAPVLAAEAKRARRAELARRAGDLLSVTKYKTIADSHHPSREELEGVELGQKVPLPSSVAGRNYPTTVHVNQATGLVWTWVHNGLDGDDWSSNNSGGGIVTRHPLTPERAALIADLRAEYDAPAALAAELRSTEAEITALLDAGWTGQQIRGTRRLFRLTEAGDGAALATRTPTQWEQAGWWDEFWYGQRKFAPADAARLADAGISPGKAAGRGDTVEEILAAAPPQIPADATRVLVLAPAGHRGSSPYPLAAMTAAQMTERLATSPKQWQWRIQADVGPHPVHVSRTGNWQVWDDNAVTLTYWAHPRPSHTEETGNSSQIVYHDDPAWPHAFTDDGERLIDLLLGARNGREIFGPHKLHWLQVARDATTTREQIDERRNDRHNGGCGATLYRHTITRPGQPDEHLWQMDEDDWYRGEDADVTVTSWLYRDEQSARAAYRAVKLR